MKNIFQKGMSKLRGVGIHTGAALVQFDPVQRALRDNYQPGRDRDGHYELYGRRGTQRRAEARAESRAAAFAALLRSTRSFSRLLIRMV